jgi:ATP-dependent RNA helicase DHX8/PRP22
MGSAQQNKGINDSALAEFVIALHGQCKTLPDFKAKLKEVGAEFPDSFVENMDRLILSMHPKYKKKAKKVNGKGKEEDSLEKDKKRRMFPGLSLPDQEWRPPATDAPDAVTKEVDGLMSQFENLSKKARPRASDLMDDDQPSPKRRRMYISPPRRRSPSPPGRRDYRTSRDASREPSYDRNQGRGRVELDERPVVYKIYNGKVTSIRDFGAFVQLEGIKGRAEGS